MRFVVTGGRLIRRSSGRSAIAVDSAKAGSEEVCREECKALLRAGHLKTGVAIQGREEGLCRVPVADSLEET